MFCLGRRSRKRCLSDIAAFERSTGPERPHAVYSACVKNLADTLTDIHAQLERAPLDADDRLRALSAVDALSEMVEQGVVDSPAGFAQLAILLEFSAQAPAAQRLLDHFPMIFGRGPEQRRTGWGAL